MINLYIWQGISRHLFVGYIGAGAMSAPRWWCNLALYIMMRNISRYVVLNEIIIHQVW